MGIHYTLVLTDEDWSIIGERALHIESFRKDAGFEVFEVVTEWLQGLVVNIGKGYLEPRDYDYRPIHDIITRYFSTYFIYDDQCAEWRLFGLKDRGTWRLHEEPST